MERNGHDFEAVWDGVKDIIAKTLISVQPTLQHNYNVAFPPENDGFSCFEILGYFPTILLVPPYVYFSTCTSGNLNNPNLVIWIIYTTFIGSVHEIIR